MALINLKRKEGGTMIGNLIRKGTRVALTSAGLGAVPLGTGLLKKKPGSSSEDQRKNDRKATNELKEKIIVPAAIGVAAESIKNDTTIPITKKFSLWFKSKPMNKYITFTIGGLMLLLVILGLKKRKFRKY